MLLKIDCSCILNNTITDENTPTHNDSHSGKRAPSFMDSITKGRAKGTPRITILFNVEVQIVGPPKFQSYLGSLARSQVPIPIDLWKDVPVDVKDNICVQYLQVI